jgi:hypothetical protein
MLFSQRSDSPPERGAKNKHSSMNSDQADSQEDIIIMMNCAAKTCAAQKNFIHFALDRVDLKFVKSCTETNVGIMN